MKTNVKIGIIYAGGTFGSYGKPLASLEPSIFLPVLETILTEHFASYPNHASDPVSWQILHNTVVKDSSQLTPSDFAHFYQLILTAMQEGMRQFVVLTGTDTLSYLGAFLAECFANSNSCVIVTGAMQPLLDTQILTDYVVNPDSDATQNLYDACKLARHGEAGVRICFAGENWHAQTVQKVHSHDLMAFVGHHRAGYPANSYTEKMSPTQREHWVMDKVGQLNEVIERLNQAKIHSIFLTPMSVEQLESQIEQCLEAQAQAIMLIGFGAGNVLLSDNIKQRLKDAKKQGCLVAVTTQCPFGGISQTYEAGAWLFDCNVLPTGRLTIPAIYARLLWLIGQYDTPSRRRQSWRHCLKDIHTVA